MANHPTRIGMFRFVVFAAILTAAPISAVAQTPAPPSPSPGAAMGKMPSREQLFTMWQSHAAQVRQSMQRYRSALLAAIAPHRDEIATLIGGYVVSDRQDQKALIESVNRILTDDERRQVVAAATKSVNEQRAMMGDAPESVQAPGATMAAGILSRWLLAPQVPPIEKMTFAQWNERSPLDVHVPGDAEQRLHLRTALLGVLSVDQRAQLADTIGAYAVANDRDLPTLAKQLDAMLSIQQQKELLAAFAEFAARQKASAAAMQGQLEQIAARFPADQRPPIPTTTIGELPQDSDAGSVLARSLLTPAMTVSIQLTQSEP